MKTSRLRSRSTGALAAATVLAALGTAQAAQAAPVRSALTTNYTTAGYLQRALGLPASDTTPALEPVTFDRFQWLLQQPGNLAVLIGDPATDPTFEARAQDAEATAKAKGVRHVYWFNPNLSGSVAIGGVKQPNLDIRKPAGITSLAAASQAKYDDAWRSLVGDYLGNGLKITHDELNSEEATVEVAKAPTAANDGGTAEVDGAKGALYDYTNDGAAPADVQDSFFVVYNEAGAGGDATKKVLAWTNLTKQPSSAAAAEDVAKAIDRVGGANVAAPTEFAFWKNEVNEKQKEQAPGAHQGAGTPVLDDADATDGWRINQITYPELVDLYENGASSANAVVLFGGTWCPNTRAVVKAVNKQAQRNDVQVYNLDTVLDGGLVGGATTSASNPLQTRNTQNYDIKDAKGNLVESRQRANPTFLYGGLVDTYLKNIKTQYDYTKGGSSVTYYAGGDATTALTTTRKLQVPFLIGYQKDAAGAGSGVTRQWIIDKGDGTFTEYMSNWWLTNPQAGQLGLSPTQLPAAAPIWSTINEQLKTVTADTVPATVVPDRTKDTDDAQYLVDADTATVTYTAATATDKAKVTVTNTGPVAANPAALADALAKLGAGAPKTQAEAQQALIDAETATTRDETLLGRLRTVNAGWGIAQLRKGTLTTRWGTRTNPSSIIGGLTAVKEVGTFFDGLPSRPVDPGTGGGTGTTPATTTPAATTPAASTPPATTPVVTTPAKPAVPALPSVGKVTGAVVKAPTHRKGGTYEVIVTVKKGASAASGKVTLKLKKGAVTKTLTGRLSTKGVVTVKVPKLAKGTWKVTITFPGDARYAKTSVAGPSIKVRR
jgi:hypothetical protein